MKGMKGEKRINMNINVGNLVEVKVGYMEEKIREGIIRKKRKEAVVRVQAVIGKKRLMTKLEDRNRVTDELWFGLCMYFRKRRLEKNNMRLYPNSPQKDKVNL